MRRAPIVLTATVAGTVAVLSFKPREPTLATANASSPSPAPAASGSPGTSSSPGASSSSGSSGSQGSGTASGRKVVTGDAIATRYGNAQVRVTIEDGKITDVQALQLQGNDPKSVQISSYAAPLLRQSALAKQSAALDAVSGATITSASYEASLQSALDKAGFQAADGSRGSTTVPDVGEGGHDGWRGGGYGDGGGDGSGPPPEFFTP